MVTYQYGVYYKTIRQINHRGDSDEKDALDSKDPEISTCANIGKLLHYLRPKTKQGPKALWKLDAFYFSKIDNMLAVLVAPERCRKLFREWNPKYIFDDEDTHSNVLDEQKHDRNQSLAEAERAQGKSVSKLSTSVTPTTTPGLTGTPSIDEEPLKTDEGGTSEKKTEEEDGVTTATRYVDCIDKIADCCCLQGNCAGTFIRNFDRVYLKVICLYLFALSFGCLVVWFWMSSRSRKEVDEMMRWTAESILARATQYMEYEFFKPQMILNIAVGGLYSGDISIDKDQFIANPQYDAFFAQYKAYKVTESSLYNLCMWESANNSMICATGDPME
eukprot:88546_1